MPVHTACVTNEYLQLMGEWTETQGPKTLIKLNIPGTCYILQYLPAQSSQKRLQSSNRHPWTSGFDSHKKAFEDLLAVWEGNTEQ